ncbi:MAG: class I SAM-dependent methyltransferase [Salibacteraceae bacterium]
MPILSPTQDPIGQGLLDYWHQKPGAPIVARSESVEDLPMAPELFFRDFESMPLLEQVALQNCKGKILDVGAGAGCHSLWLQQQHFDIRAIDVSPGAVALMQARGLQKVTLADLQEWEHDTQYDTVLLLMNGIGLVQTLEGFTRFFKQMDALLAPGGQILCDSSDLKYLYQGEDAQELPEDRYYGELNYQLVYKNIECPPFEWLFVDFGHLSEAAKAAGYRAEMFQKGEHYDFLARIVRE